MNTRTLSAGAFALACIVPLWAVTPCAYAALSNESPPASLDSLTFGQNTSDPNRIPDPDANVVGVQSAAPSATAQAPTSNGNVPMNPRNSPMPPTVDTAPAADKPAAVVANNSADQTFTTLDSNHKGYLNQADVASHKYLAGHFQQCDSNRDSRLSKDEVTICLKQMPPAEQ